MDFINILAIALSVITLSNGNLISYTNKYFPTNSMTMSIRRVPTSTTSPIPWCPVGPPITKFVELKTLNNGCICTAFESAVCGTDGSSYFNRCILDCAAKKQPCLKLKCNDECSLCAHVVPPRTCSKEYKPICDSNCVTHNNTCLFNAVSKQFECLRINCNTSCEFCDLCEPCKCSKTKETVCGSDGVSYSNICQLGCVKRQNPTLNKIYDGRCKDECVCSTEYDPVCGTDDNSYVNFCIFSCAAKMDHNLKIKCKGVCDPIEF